MKRKIILRRPRNTNELREDLQTRSVTSWGSILIFGKVVSSIVILTGHHGTGRGIESSPAPHFHISFTDHSNHCVRRQVYGTFSNAPVVRHPVPTVVHIHASGEEPLDHSWRSRSAAVGQAFGLSGVLLTSRRLPFSESCVIASRLQRLQKILGCQGRRQPCGGNR